jgi:hypothetical protein
VLDDGLISILLIEATYVAAPYLYIKLLSKEGEIGGTLFNDI